MEHGIGMELATAASYLRAYYRVSSLLNCHVNTFHEFSFCICCQNLPDIRRVKGRDGFRCSAPRLDACQISRIEGLEKCPSRGARSFLPWVSGKKTVGWWTPSALGPGARLPGLVNLHLEDNEIVCVEGVVMRQEFSWLWPAQCLIYFAESSNGCGVESCENYSAQNPCVKEVLVDCISIQELMAAKPNNDAMQLEAWRSSFPWKPWTWRETRYKGKVFEKGLGQCRCGPTSLGPPVAQRLEDVWSMSCDGQTMEDYSKGRWDFWNLCGVSFFSLGQLQNLCPFRLLVNHVAILWPFFVPIDILN